MDDLIREVVSVAELEAAGWPEHFYEVELVKPLRIKNDLLLNREKISLYLAQVAPVPFSPMFQFGGQITSYLSQYLSLGEIEIYVDGATAPLYRPYQDTYAYGEDKRDTFTEPEFKFIEGMNGGAGAIVWLLHHGYHGSIPSGEGVAGLRARKGNIQVGDHRIFAEIFPEARFASWTVGEVHVVDERAIPNGRRDEFEQNAHYSHLTNHLSAIGDHIARMCRSRSVVRNRIKAFDIGAQKIDEQLTIVEQGAIGRASATAIIQDVRSEIFEIKRIADDQELPTSDQGSLSERLSMLVDRLATAENLAMASDGCTNIPEGEREVVRKMIELIYACSANRIAAKSLVDRILARLGE